MIRVKCVIYNEKGIIRIKAGTLEQNDRNRGLNCVFDFMVAKIILIE